MDLINFPSKSLDRIKAVVLSSSSSPIQNNVVPINLNCTQVSSQIALSYTLMKLDFFCVCFLFNLITNRRNNGNNIGTTITTIIIIINSNNHWIKPHLDQAWMRWCHLTECQSQRTFSRTKCILQCNESRLTEWSKSVRIPKNNIEYPLSCATTRIGLSHQERGGRGECKKRILFFGVYAHVHMSNGRLHSPLWLTSPFSVRSLFYQWTAVFFLLDNFRIELNQKWNWFKWSMLAWMDIVVVYIYIYIRWWSWTTSATTTAAIWQCGTGLTLFVVFVRSFVHSFEHISSHTSRHKHILVECSLYFSKSVVSCRVESFHRQSEEWDSAPHGRLSSRPCCEGCRADLVPFANGHPLYTTLPNLASSFSYSLSLSLSLTLNLSFAFHSNCFCKIKWTLPFLCIIVWRKKNQRLYSWDIRYSYMFGWVQKRTWTHWLDSGIDVQWNRCSQLSTGKCNRSYGFWCLVWCPSWTKSIGTYTHTHTYT